MFQICFGLYLGGEILAQRPHVGGGIFHTEFIQICTMFGVDFDKKQHIHQILPRSPESMDRAKNAPVHRFCLGLFCAGEDVSRPHVPSLTQLCGRAALRSGPRSP